MTRFAAFEGNLVADPELKVFEDGNASVRFRLIDNPVHTDRRTGELVKEDPVAMSCVARDPFAHNIAERASKGKRLIVFGTLKTRAYTDSDGNRRTTDYLAVEAVGESYRFRAAAPAPAQQQPAQQPAAPAPTEPAPWPEAVQPGSGSAG